MIPKQTLRNAEGDSLRDEAIQQLEMKFGEGWIDYAVDVIQRVAASSPDGFTSDNVWPNVPEVDEPRAMGAAFTRARKLKLIKPMDAWKPSNRAECHSRPVRVWVAA